MSPRIGILVVAYNAESTLRSVIARIPPSIMDKVEEIFVFDDASQDATHDVGREIQRERHDGKLSIYRNEVNLMYGGNQRRGYQYAIEKGLDIVVLLHGDGQYAPEVMQRLLTPLEQGRADMVMGSRMMEKGAARQGNMPTYLYIGMLPFSAAPFTIIRLPMTMSASPVSSGVSSSCITSGAYCPSPCSSTTMSSPRSIAYW